MNKTSKERKPYFREILKGWYKTRQRIWEDDYKTFLEEGTWDYNFEYENTINEFEQSFLSQMLFGNLLIENNYCSSFVINRYFIYTKSNKSNTTIRFLFDVMNNPKECHTLGKQAKLASLDSIDEWISIYHSIGNFAPVPGLRWLQREHKQLGERWDFLLKHLQDNWLVLQNENTFDYSFNEYMVNTCQQLYFKINFSELKELIKGNPNFLKDATDKDWVENIAKWNKNISDKKLELISFNNDIDSIVDDILLLIEARGKCILAMVKKKCI